jgi:hypothetical protein
LDRPVLIDTQIIMWITILSSAWEDPLPMFTDETHEKELVERMKEKYGMHKGACGLDVERINDDYVNFLTQVLDCKLLRKCHKYQVPTGVIPRAEKCTARVHMNWANFLVNQFLTDYREAQEKGMELHYAWLLILIALVS